MAQPQNYCITSPNSVGAGSIIGWAGSTSIAANDATVFAEFAPPGQFGIFFYGEGESALPFGEGLLCVDGGSNGLIRMDPPISIDALGSAQLLLDYTQPPMDAGPGQVMVGDSRRWQFWYRDPAGGGAAFNLSDGVHTTYCP